MKTILDEIVENKRREVEELKREKSINDFTSSPLFSRIKRSLVQSIKASDFGIIAEIKRKSPSGGEIFPGLSPVEQALYYQQNGASAISVLTDQVYFGGSMKDLIQVSNNVEIPVLRKEFIIDEIQLYEAKAGGADAVLLIAMILTKEEIIQLTDKAHELKLEVLFEVHDPEDEAKIYDQVDLVAVNNRNLAKQDTDLRHSFDWIDKLPKHIPLISASGISTSEHVHALKTIGYSGALVGESILRNRNLEELTLNFSS
jgi:indole-3-glycerol phosphate synthase